MIRVKIDKVEIIFDNDIEHEHLNDVIKMFAYNISAINNESLVLPSADAQSLASKYMIDYIQKQSSQFNR